MRFNYDNKKRFREAGQYSSGKKEEKRENVTKEEIGKFARQYLELVVEPRKQDEKLYGEPKEPVKMNVEYFENYLKDIGPCSTIGVLFKRETRKEENGDTKTEIVLFKSEEVPNEENGTEAQISIKGWIMGSLQNPGISSEMYKKIYSGRYVVEYREKDGNKYVALTCPDTQPYTQIFYIREKVQ